MEYKPFTLSFSDSIEFYQRDVAEYKKMTHEHFRTNRDWIENKIAEFEADWIMVSGTSGEVLAHGDTSEYPTKEFIRGKGDETGEYPFLFHRAPIIVEETDKI